MQKLAVYTGEALEELERALLPAGKKAEKPAVKKKRRSSRT
jgi:hypothetical protein